MDLKPVTKLVSSMKLKYQAYEQLEHALMQLEQMEHYRAELEATVANLRSQISTLKVDTENIVMRKNVIESDFHKLKESHDKFSAQVRDDLTAKRQEQANVTKQLAKELDQAKAEHKDKFNALDNDRVALEKVVGSLQAKLRKLRESIPE